MASDDRTTEGTRPVASRLHVFRSQSVALKIRAVGRLLLQCENCVGVDVFGWTPATGSDEGVTQGVRTNSLGDPGSSGDAPHDPPGGVTIEALVAGVNDDRTLQSFTDGQVDATSNSWRQRHGDDLAALTHNGEGPVSAFQTECFDVGTCRDLRDRERSTRYRRGEHRTAGARRARRVEDVDGVLRCRVKAIVPEADPGTLRSAEGEAHER